MEEKARFTGVIFVQFRKRILLEKLKDLCVAQELKQLIDKKMAAIKIHFGEPGNLSYLRPNYAKLLQMW